MSAVLARAASSGVAGGAATHAEERRAIALRLLGEAAEQALRRVDKVIERRAPPRFGNRLRQPAVAHQPVAEAPRISERTGAVRR